MKKIAIFTQNLTCGGVQKSIYSLVNYLKNEFDISIILGEDNKKIYYSFVNINIYTIKTIKIDINKKAIGEELFDYRISELNKILEDLKPDVLLSYEDYNNLIALSTLYKCKKVVSCRVNIKDSYDNNIIHLLDGSFYYEKIKSLYKKANKIITVSSFIEKELRTHFLLENIKTIYNGIEEVKINKESLHSNFILNIGRLHKQKGQIDLIKAFDKIKNQINQNLLIVGDGMLKNQLEEEIKKRGLEERIFLVGLDESYKYIINCTLFVFPSYYEGFSNTILEVMSSKKNIIAYNYKGSEEILFQDNLVPLGNIDELSLKILFYLNNKKENELLENKLFEKSKEFTLSNTLTRYKKEIKLLCVE